MKKQNIAVIGLILIAVFAISAFAYKGHNYNEERHEQMTKAIESGDLETIQELNNNRPRKGCQGSCQGHGNGYHGMYKGENRGDNFVDENNDGICDKMQ